MSFYNDTADKIAKEREKMFDEKKKNIIYYKEVKKLYDNCRKPLQQNNDEQFDKLKFNTRDTNCVQVKNKNYNNQYYNYNTELIYQQQQTNQCDNQYYGQYDENNNQYYNNNTESIYQQQQTNQYDNQYYGQYDNYYQYYDHNTQSYTKDYYHGYCYRPFQQYSTTKKYTDQQYNETN